MFAIGVWDVIVIDSLIVMVDSIYIVESSVVYGSVSIAVSKTVETNMVVTVVAGAVGLPAMSLQAALRIAGSKDCKAGGVINAVICLLSMIPSSELYSRSRSCKTSVKVAVAVT